MHNYSTAWEAHTGPSLQQAESITYERPEVLFLAVSQPLSRHVERELKLPPGSVRHLPPYVDAIFALRPTPSLPREKRLLFPNRVMTKKGIEPTLAALSLCRDPALRIDFVANFSPNPSPSKEQRFLVDLITDHPQARLIEPAHTPPTTAALYGRYTGVLTPSTEPEGFGLVPAEALVLGITPAASRAGGLEELIDAGALAIDADDPTNFARTLDQLARSDRRNARERRASWVRFRFARSITALRLHIEYCVAKG
jgi:glycosyltransferase involved in cell wall biosynthesis